MKEFFAGLAVFILAVLIAVAFFFIAGLALYFLAPLSFDIELTYMQSVAIVTVLRLLGAILFSGHTTKVKAVDNE